MPGTWALGWCLLDVESLQIESSIALNGELGGTRYQDSYINDLRVSEDGRYLYAADVTNFRLAIVDLGRKQVVSSVSVGRYPYALCVTGNRVHVANIGLFEYQPVPPPQGGSFDPRGLTRPPFGYPSKEARDGLEFEGRHIPGLGVPNVPESFSVWTVDATDPEKPVVRARLKTGLLVGAPSDNGKTVGGSAPNFLVASRESLFVSNGNNDIIERVDLDSGEIAAWQRIVPSPLVARLLAYNGIEDRAADRAAMASPLIPTVPGEVSRQIKHVVFIAKENHTYDTIFDPAFPVPGTIRPSCAGDRTKP